MRFQWVVLVIVGLALSADVWAKPLPPYGLAQYAKECEQELGPIPRFDCQNGQVAPVYNSDLHESITDKNHRGFGTLCDHPSLLRTDRVNWWGDFNPCIPFTRLGRSGAGKGFPTQWVWSCRRYYVRAEKDAHFDDINMIGHNPETGATCFFVSKINRIKPTRTQDLGHDGSRIPSMFTGQGEKFWKSPREMDTIPAWRGGSQRCVECHDNDPFIHTPFFQQVMSGQVEEPLLPSNPKGRYYIVGSQVFNGPAWKLRHLVSPEGKSCTKCHRIGDRRSCGDLSAMAVGLQGHAHLTKAYQKRPWMPQHDEIWSFDQEKASEKAISTVQFINRCCEKPTLPECKWSPVPGRP